ncbi:MAG: MFS transporter [Kordiimonadaceae bacterium]|nr:MFS transporter [Kordiimonadaceae bacterium]
MSNTTLMPRSEALFACATIISGTALGLAGIDLVLPSVPEMPLIFGTTIATAQLVLAAFVFGSTLGMLLFGSLAAHYGRRRLFIWSLFAYAVFSFACIFFAHNLVAYQPALPARGGCIRGRCTRAGPYPRLVFRTWGHARHQRHGQY